MLMNATIVERYVGEVSIADLGFLVPLIHGVDSFLEFGAAGLVDAAGINPNVLVVVL